MLSFPLPQIVPKPYDLLSYVEQNILKNAGNQQLLVATDFYRMKEKYCGSQWGPENVWSPIFFKISSFVLIRRKYIYTGLKQLDGEKKRLQSK